MPYVGYDGVANLANTTDGFALHTSAANVVGSTAGDDVWTLLNVGLGGYVVGRSAESVARTLANRPVNKEQENG